MKNALFPLVALIASILAQDLASLPECEQLCVGGVLAKAASLGCAATDGGQPSAECLCSKIDFAYALRDCSTESCPSGTNIQPVNEYGLSYCQSAQASASGTDLAAIALFSSGAGDAAASASASSGALGSATESASSETASGSGSETGSLSAVSTVPVVSTIVSDGSTTETTLSSSVILADETTTGASSEETSATTTEGEGEGATTEPIVSTDTSGGSTRETTIGSTTIAAKESSSSSSSSSAAGAAGLSVPFSIPGLFGSLRSPNVAVAQALGLGILGIAGLFWGAGMMDAF